MGIDIIQTIAQCLQGDKNGWDLFVREYVPIARKILSKFQTLSSEDRDNVAQNILMKLLERGFSQFKGRTRYEFLAFYKRVVENEAKDYLKSENRRNNRLIDLNQRSDPEEENSGYPDEFEGVASSSTPPDIVSETKEILKIMDGIIHTNPIPDQQLFLYKAQGYQDKEISDFLKIPMGTVASRYSRMIEKIRDGLNQIGVENIF